LAIHRGLQPVVTTLVVIHILSDDVVAAPIV
jgi:hypothetical protein